MAAEPHPFRAVGIAFRTFHSLDIGNRQLAIIYDISIAVK
jgi:hypothetical protein